MRRAAGVFAIATVVAMLFPGVAHANIVKTKQGDTWSDVPPACLGPGGAQCSWTNVSNHDVKIHAFNQGNAVTWFRFNRPDPPNSQVLDVLVAVTNQQECNEGDFDGQWTFIQSGTKVQVTTSLNEFNRTGSYNCRINFVRVTFG